MTLAPGCRSVLALLTESNFLGGKEVASLLDDLGDSELFLSEGDWLSALREQTPEAVLVAAAPERERQLVCALQAVGLPVLGGEDRLLPMGGDRALLSSWLRALNLPALPVFRPDAAPPLPRPFDLALSSSVHGSRTLQPTTEQELTELVSLLTSTVDRYWWSPRVEDRVVVGVLAGEPLGTVGIKQITRPGGTLVAQQATIPAPLSAAESSEVLALGRRAAVALGLVAPCEVELGRLEGRFVVCDVRRNLAMDSQSPLGRLLRAHGIVRREVYDALRVSSLITPARPIASAQPSGATVH